jgi:predicted transcriptional regulator
MTDYSDIVLRDLRLTILKSLAAQPGFTANENILQYEARAVGINRSREMIRTEMRFLASLSAIEVREFGSVMVGTLKARGQDHVKGLIELDGVNPPSPV